MKYYTILFLLVLIYCSHDTSYDSNMLLPTSDELKEDFDYKFLSHDSICIFSKESAIFIKPFFKSIVVGYIQNYAYNPVDTIDIEYNKINQNYLLTFSKKYDISDLRTFDYESDHLEMQIIAYINNNDFRFFTFNIYPHKYPYESAEIMLRKKDIYNQEAPWSHFIDFFITPEYLYYMESPGNHRLFKLDRKTYRAELLMNTSVEFFTYHQGYLYGDFLFRRSLIRYNLETRDTDLEIGFAVLDNAIIRGIDTYQNTLYVLHNNSAPANVSEYLLSSFTLSGEFIESIPFNARCWGFCIYDDIVYGIDSFDEESWLQRYSLLEHKFLAPLKSPSNDLYAIQIVNDILFYALYQGDLICYILLGNLSEKENYH